MSITRDQRLLNPFSIDTELCSHYPHTIQTDRQNGELRRQQPQSGVFWSPEHQASRQRIAFIAQSCPWWYHRVISSLPSNAVIQPAVFFFSHFVVEGIQFSYLYERNTRRCLHWLRISMPAFHRNNKISYRELPYIWSHFFIGKRVRWTAIARSSLKWSTALL